MQEDPKVLIDHITELHTTQLGEVRIKKNLNLETEDVIAWCKEQVNNPEAVIKREGKNWYVTWNHYVLTINAYSYTVITAHPTKK